MIYAAPSSTECVVTSVPFHSIRGGVLLAAKDIVMVKWSEHEIHDTYQQPARYSKGADDNT